MENPWRVQPLAAHARPLLDIVETSNGGGEPPLVASLNPTPAEAADFPITDILAGIDAAALACRDAAIAERGTVRAERAARAAEGN